ncbi:nucleotide-binding protein [Clostridia bacterium]|nr:nucleotide-binding protein [Clostridia bacterium]
MEFVIITGLSGSGKSCAVNALEDIGYYCVDNMPPALMSKFAELCDNNPTINKVAFVIDIRGRSLFYDVINDIERLRSAGYTVRIVFMNTRPTTICRRYKETRRTHPLYAECGEDIEAAIHKEAEIMSSLRNIADFTVDTTNMNTATLKNNILNLFMDNVGKSMVINCVSFGFKYGLPLDADMIFDVRFLANPFYNAELKHKTGLDSAVYDFVVSDPASAVLTEKLDGLFGFLVPMFVKEGKTQLTLGFGCTGGKHRSVTYAEMYYHKFLADEYEARVLHRDIAKTG